jgi:hypothetical protein
MITYRTYTTTIRFRDRLVGGIPAADPDADSVDLYEKWARGQGVENAPGFDQTLPESLAADPDMPVAVADIAGPQMKFRSNDDGLYVEARQVKAMLREAAQRLGMIKTTRGTRQVLQHDIHVRGLDGSQKLPLGCQEPDGTDMRPISIVTPQGPRTALKRFDYVTERELTFVIRVLAGGVGDGIVGPEQLRDMLELGGDLGLGADRSQGEGTFEVVAFEEAEEA